ncbi:MAG: RNA-binding protein [Candidatus Aenigmarchaeota archaeon]|nr:RNA-binding protein [Candidatus Aenigmarchaeota archaeon]
MEERKLVICGDPLGDGRAGHGAYEENGKVFSRFVGLAEQKNGMHFVIPLSGIYNPKKGDGVIGKVEDIIFSKWLIDINSPYQAALALNEAVDEFIDLTKNDLTKYFSYDDLIFAEILSVTKTKNIQLSMKERKCRKLKGGRIIRVTPSKVPRIIGRSGSMVEMIKQMTGTQIVVGQNGLVWVRGDNEDIATEAVLLIEEKSHKSGLTEDVKSLLERRMKESGVSFQQPAPQENELQWGETNE